MNLSNSNSTGLRTAMLSLCIALPWLNPFTSSPSTAVVPLLLSWMMAACAMLAVVDMPLSKWRGWTTPPAVAWGLLAWLALVLLWVPTVVDRALTAGLVASLICIWLMVGVGRRAAVNEALLRNLAGTLLAAAVLSSLLGMVQYLGWAQAWSPWVNQPLKGDAFANLRQRNLYASLTSLGLVVLLAGVAAQSQIQALSRKRWLQALLVLNVLAAGVACSMSRTGALQWALVSVCVALWGIRRAQQQPSAAKGLVLLSITAPLWLLLWSVLMPWLALQTTGEWGASLILRVTGQVQDYDMCASRRVLWANVLTMIAQHPWLGWGWGETDFAHFMTAYSGMRFCDMLDNAHNLPLHLALELGLPFACVLMFGVWRWVVRRAPWRERQAWRMMAWCLLLVLGVHSMLEYPLWYGPFQMTLGLAIGVLWSPPARVAQQEAQAWPSLLAAVLFIGCLYAAWDFHRVGQIYRAPAARDATYRADPLAHAKQSWLFKNQAEFAELTVQKASPENAAQLWPLALRVMHYSPETRVVQRALDSAIYLGHDAQAEVLFKRLQDVTQSAPSP